MRALVTGSTGFVGRYLAEYLLGEGDEVLGTYIDMQPHPFVWKTYKLDVCDAHVCESLLAQYQPDVLYHLAAITFPPEADKDFPRALTTNVEGTYNLLSACARHSPETKVVFVSSAHIYGKVSPGSLPLTEDHPAHPHNNYGLTKSMAELVVRQFEGELNTVIMRPFNHIGPRQHESFVVSGFAKQLASIALGLSPAVIEVGHLSPQRDFCDVRDIVRAYRLAALGGAGVFNLCSGVPISVQEVLESLLDISRLNVSIEEDPARVRAVDIPVLYGSFARMHDELSWEPLIPLRQSLEDVYSYWLHRLKVAPTFDQVA